FEAPQLPPPDLGGDGDGSGPNGRRPRRPTAPTRRYNALGVMEDVPPEDEEGTDETLDIGPEEPPQPGASVRPEPTVHVGGKSSSLSKAMAGSAVPGVPGVPGGRTADWSNVGRNDPCPCGSGK